MAGGGGVGHPYVHPSVPTTGVAGISPRLPEGGVALSSVAGGAGWNEREELLSRELEEAKVSGLFASLFHSLTLDCLSK